ncbi:MAG: ATP-binding cassette domain-containing protein [Armatimonadetes bacterium]|nr:ATP-binding cassette domain-containing protein [Armatimonadota bacterium]NIM23989.1 ATP-binding cassette domain-containing protein [Armatimonadota bacterium]NIM67839.1 ATP-binding cassette domain-containing protein [Armatimonadota bacterium]NIM76370.1 ATP-binding cassette domain-containing protein [Armatimonadota bacterium]NIN06069.1 ATP-binding cassette domain-containing protein [Armatimonadota bacterium]
MIFVEAQKALREFNLSVAFEAEAGETLVIIGPSGCGKTTTLNIISGLLRPDKGRVVLDDRTLFDSSAEIDVPVDKRAIGYVFQDFALFPHLSVTDNVAYGLSCRKMSKQQTAERVDWALEMVGLKEMAHRKPPLLSGGEKQRVALARAIALDSPLLLLDEPLGALDAQTRQSVRGELRAVLKKVKRMTIMVTHDHVDALTFGDKICVLDKGEIIQFGDKHELLVRPRCKFVAELTGANFFEGTISSLRHHGLAAVRVGDSTLYVATEEMGDTLLSFYPSDVTLGLNPPTGSAVNVFESRVSEIVHFGDRVRVSLNSSLPMVAEITADSLTALNLREGSRVFASLKATAIRTFR